jgi:DNA-binding transcriptional ArsR family regulator
MITSECDTPFPQDGLPSSQAKGQAEGVRPKRLTWYERCLAAYEIANLHEEPPATSLFAKKHPCWRGIPRCCHALMELLYALAGGRPGKVTVTWVRSLATHLGCSYRTVVRQLRVLVEADLILKGRAPGSREKPGGVWFALTRAACWVPRYVPPEEVQLIEVTRYCKSGPARTNRARAVALLRDAVNEDTRRGYKTYLKLRTKAAHI